MTAPLTVPPIAPSTLRPDTFAAEMDARLAWQDVNVAETTALLPIIDAAAAAAPIAVAAAAAAVATSNAAAWVSGQAYGAGANAISGVDFQTYRAMTSVTSTTDPAADPTRWIQIGALRQVRVAVSGSARTVTIADLGKLIDFTGGDATLTLSSCASTGIGFWVDVVNSGTGKVTLALSGADTCDTLTTYNMYMRERRHFVGDGVSAWKTVVQTPYLIALTSLFSHKQAPGYAFNDIFLVGAGGGGGSGCKGGAGIVRLGGACGGTPATVRRRLPALAANTVTTFTPGNGGNPGASVTANSTAGSAGAAGGNTTYGALTAFGGCGGVGPAVSVGYLYTTGSSSLNAGTSGTTNSNSLATRGGLPCAQPVIGQVDTDSQEGGASAHTGQTVGGNAVYSGAAPGSVQGAGATPPTGGSSQFGVGAAGHGGWINDSDTFPAAAGSAGKTGGWNLYGANPGICGISPTVGQNGAANAGGLYDVGNSGGGGGSTNTSAANAQKGGDGSFPGGAGGGGGAVVNGTGNSGAGGAGANGYGVIAGVPG